jgi:hypothetical protein
MSGEGLSLIDERNRQRFVQSPMPFQSLAADRNIHCEEVLPGQPTVEWCNQASDDYGELCSRSLPSGGCMV